MPKGLESAWVMARGKGLVFKTGQYGEVIVSVLDLEVTLTKLKFEFTSWRLLEWGWSWSVIFPFEHLSMYLFLFYVAEHISGMDKFLDWRSTDANFPMRQNDPQHLSGLVRRILYQFIGPNWRMPVNVDNNLFSWLHTTIDCAKYTRCTINYTRKKITRFALRHYGFRVSNKPAHHEEQCRSFLLAAIRPSKVQFDPIHYSELLTFILKRTSVDAGHIVYVSIQYLHKSEPVLIPKHYRGRGDSRNLDVDPFESPSW